jgi:hypothetical protein
MNRLLKTNPVLFALATSVFVMAGCTSLNHLSLRGRVENNSYIAPENNFSCPIPKIGAEGHTSDSIDRQNSGIAGTVRFIGFVSIYRIDYRKMTVAPASLHEELEDMLNTQLDLYRKIPSRAYVLQQESAGDRLFAVLVAPEGNLSAVDGYGKHKDLSRAMLIFKHGDYVYAVSTDDRDSFAVASDKSPKRIDRLRKQVEEFTASIQFK